MRRMETVMTVRLPKDDLKGIEEISIKGRKDKSTTIRELVELGKIYFAIMEYRENRISIGKAAEIAALAISEIKHLLCKLGVESNLELSHYIETQKLAEDILS